MTAEHTRRTAIATAAVATGGTLLVGCGGGSSPSDGSPPRLPADRPLATLADIPVGESRAVTSGEENIIVSRTAEATAVAFSAVCTHQGCKVQPEAAELRCPCHGSTFDPRTGEALSGPANAPLPEIPVRVENGQVLPS
jgi:nitrite reductase/ring-hydroxylating ferredoxin subunit